MAYADFGSKIIQKSYGRFKMAMAEAVVAGDLITADGYLADAEDSKAASFVACEAGAALAVITVAMAAEIKKAPTVATGGGVTRGDHGGTAGTVLYLDGGAEQGKAIEDVGTIAQQVGWVVSQDQALLIPMHVLSGTNATFSGTLTVGGATALNANVTIASTKTLTMTKGNITMTEGNVAFTKGQISHKVKDGHDKAYSVLVTDDIICCELTEDTTLTLPAAVAGMHFTIMHKSGDKTLTIVPTGDDKLIDNCGADADGGVHVKIVDDKGLDCYIKLVAVDATNWVPVAAGGTWTFSG